MKYLPPLLSLALALSCLIHAARAGEFINLDFDAANTNNVIDGFFGTREDLVPGWELFSGEQVVNTVQLNLLPIGYNLAILYDLAHAAEAGAYVEGRFSLTLIPELDRETSMEIPFTLAQNGDVPSDVRSLRFISYYGPVEVFVNDQPLTLFFDPRGLPPGVTRIAADISPFAGQTVRLEFQTSSSGRFTGYGLDSISFSPEPIPEPATSVLLLAGGAAGACAGRRLARSTTRRARPGLL